MKVLVPVDGSENSLRAARYAMRMAKTHPSVEVTLLTVAYFHDAGFISDAIAKIEPGEYLEEKITIDNVPNIGDKTGEAFLNDLLESINRCKKLVEEGYRLTNFWTSKDIGVQFELKKKSPLDPRFEEIFTKRLNEAKKIFEDEGVPVSTELLAGEPGKVIMTYVEENGIDKVVMGSRGLSPLKAMVLGSIAYKVLSTVKVPVTIIK